MQDQTPVNTDSQLRALLSEAGFAVVRPFSERFSQSPKTVLQFMEGDSRPPAAAESDMVLWVQGFVAASKS